MTYWYKSDGGYSGIYNVETESCLGYVRRHGKGYQVEDGDHLFVAVVESEGEVGRVLTEYYRKHSKWRYYDEFNVYEKWTEFGLLQIRQDDDGCWSAHRNAEQPLVYNDEVATFPTPPGAQSAAEAHRGDGATGSRDASDGLSWFMFGKVMPPWGDALEATLPPEKTYT